MPGAPQLTSAATADLAPAFALFFHQLPPGERTVRIARTLDLVASGELDPEGIALVREGGQLLGAIVALALPGAGGLVWPPRVVECEGRAALEDRLMRYATDWLQQRGARLAQALLVAEEVPLAAPLVRNSFRHTTTLVYLRHDLGDLPPADVTGPSALTCQPYGDAIATLFAQTLERTYEGTLDCPELNGVRSIEQILEGHRAQGEYRPELWWLVCEGERPVGVVLLSGVPEWQAWDVAYVGIVPEARRRGLGRAVTSHILHAAFDAGRWHVSLAVDKRNLPAWILYTRLGFVPFDEREVYLTFF